MRNQQPARPVNASAIAWPLVAMLLALTWVGVSLSTAATVPLEPAAQPSSTLSIDEATYYEYVAPRLTRLVGEMDSVVALVRERSRNVIALSVHGDRIETLAAEIEAFGPVPARFAAIHEEILGGTKRATTAIADARAALRRFDFSGIPHLIPDFEDGSRMLHEALDALTGVASVTPAAGWGQSRQLFV